MTTFTRLAGGIMLTALMTFAGAAQAATFVYVSNAEDGDIGSYTLMPDGSLQPGAKVEAGKPVKNPVTLAAIKANPELAEMKLVKLSRLSVSPVTKDEWDEIVEMSK